MELAEVVARMEIHQALMRFCRGVDRGDADLICSAYFPEARDQHGAFEGTAAELAAMLIPDMDASNMVGQHMITNILYEFDDEHHARVESYYFVLHPEQSGIIWTGGRYLDEFECRDGEWKIAARKVLIDWSKAAEEMRPWALAGTLPQGNRHQKDPSASFFSTPLT